MSNEDIIRELYRPYLEAQSKGDGEAVASFYTEDAMLIPTERQPMRGRAEIFKYSEGPPSSGVEMDLNHIEIEGKLAWVTGLVHWDADGQRRYTAFVDVWRRENGDWRIAACIWNSSDGFAIA